MTYRCIYFEHIGPVCDALGVKDYLAHRSEVVEAIRAERMEQK